MREEISVGVSECLELARQWHYDRARDVTMNPRSGTARRRLSCAKRRLANAMQNAGVRVPTNLAAEVAGGMRAHWRRKESA